MRNVLGENLTLTLFGESHGPYIGATLDGFPAGIKVDKSFINDFLSKRRPNGKTDTSRIENDNYQFISGIFNDITTGAPITVIVPNENVKSKDYDELCNSPRPGHADYTAHIKYDGFEDYRGGGHFSGRVTVAIVILGALVVSALHNKNIEIGTHILRCGEAKDSNIKSIKDIEAINKKEFPVLDDIVDNIINEISNAQSNNDSIGGITETVIYGVQAGIGEPWFSSVESLISKALFGIGGIKGIEFGEGFNFANLSGSTSNDQFNVINNKVFLETNHNGGINGGITNGMPITFNCAIKPTPSISKEQKSIRYDNNKQVDLEIKGRHDPAIIRRICIVITSLTAIVLLDLLLTRYGQNYLK